MEVIKDQQDMIGICAIKWWDGPKIENSNQGFIENRDCASIIL